MWQYQEVADIVQMCGGNCILISRNHRETIPSIFHSPLLNFFCVIWMKSCLLKSAGRRRRESVCAILTQISMKTKALSERNLAISRASHCNYSHCINNHVSRITLWSHHLGVSLSNTRLAPPFCFCLLSGSACYRLWSDLPSISS
jgi:hypothetical protein